MSEQWSGKWLNHNLTEAPPPVRFAFRLGSGVELAGETPTLLCLYEAGSDEKGPILHVAMQMPTDRERQLVLVLLRRLLKDYSPSQVAILLTRACLNR